MLIRPVFIICAWLVISLHGFCTWLPLGRADLSMSVNILESLNKSKDFLYVSSDRKIIVGSMSQDTLSINNESSSAGNSSIWSSCDKSTVNSCNSLSDVSNKRNL